MLKRVLVANRGEIAVRIIQALRDLRIDSVAVYSEADRDAMHVRLADRAVCIGRAPAEESYLNSSNLIEAARGTGCDAIHPGYGFLSESPEFARACRENGLVFIGPSAEVIEKLGNKAEARRIADRAGVRVVPGSAGPVPDEDGAAAAAARVGYPVLVKASAGGGGRGMRRAENPGELESAYREAVMEAEKCFGNGEVYLEKLIRNPRHIEFQILADQKGNVIHLGERNCSIQRRRQKMLEEAPAFGLSEALRQEMGSAAVRVARAAGYENAGTVEFILDSDGSYYFIEMNTRIQVEHPVTEAVTGVDLVREQIRIASGLPLEKKQEQIEIRGHALECRICAEDPLHDFAPSPGTVTSLRLPSGSGVRTETALYQGAEISPYYDSLCAKIITVGDTRLEAIRRMRRALRETEIRGITTTLGVEALILYNTDFLRGHYDTDFIEKNLPTLLHLLDQENAGPEPDVTCPDCGATFTREEFRKSLYVCPKCGKHGRMPVEARIESIVDPGTFRELLRSLSAENPIGFRGYTEKISREREKSGIREAVITGTGKIGGIRTFLMVMDGRFMMASMGTAVGEKIARGFEYATSKKLPVVLFAASGGARMQEGILSLFQMSKTAAALARHSEAGLFSVTVMTDPTMGGVTASFASLSDVILAEPDARIGFAGARVIEQTIGEKLPEGFQRSEFQFEHGFVDEIVSRSGLRERITTLLALHDPKEQSRARKNFVKECASVVSEPEEEDPDAVKRTPAERVELARSTERPTTREYIRALITDFVLLAGDRKAGEDPAMTGGIGRFHGMPVTILGHQKGSDLTENLRYRFGMPNPEGYRKAVRLMKEAEKFGRPVITFVDTPGAFPGKEAEERGQGEAIAEAIQVMSRLKVPVISIVIGEGESGGALAISASDRLLMLENSVYSVLSPEGFASILWKDSSRWKEACELMCLTAEDLKLLGICDRIVPEGAGGAQEDRSRTFRETDRALCEELQPLLGKSGEKIRQERYKKLRSAGRQTMDSDTNGKEKDE